MKVNYLFIVFVSMELQKHFLGIFEGKTSEFSLSQKAVGRWSAAGEKVGFGLFPTKKNLNREQIYSGERILK